MSITPDKFSAWLSNHLKNSTDQNTIDLIPARCGVGKSISMVYQIAEALSHSNKIGILLITDEIERMNGYVNNNYNSKLYNYIQKNRDRIYVVESKNIANDYSNIFTKQIIIMSTQRFFNLTRDEVKKIVDSHKPKRNIFVDERALLLETVTIKEGDFDDLDKLISERLDNTKKEKDWLLDQERALRDRFNGYFADLEKENKNRNNNSYMRFFTDPFKAATTDDRLFEELLCKSYYKDLKTLQHWDYRKKVQAILQIVKSGALFVSKKRKNSKDKKSQYSRFFITVLNHYDLLLNTGSKSVILDATGDLDPIYDGWCINKVNCSQFQRDLSKLTINIVDVVTSKGEIGDFPQDNKRLNAIIKYVNTIPDVDCVFTYGKGKRCDLKEQITAEREFYNAGYKCTDHFGNIHGKNEYRDKINIVQIGLNRYAREDYYALGLAIAMNRYPPNSKSISCYNPKTLAKKVMQKMILSDIEQNLFRGTIRSIENQQNQTYTLIYHWKSHRNDDGEEQNDLAELAPMIKERYEKLGATVNLCDCPEIIQQQRILDQKGDVAAKRVLQFMLNLSPGEKFKFCKLLKDCNVSRNTFEKMLNSECNLILKETLSKWNIRKGWYQKPEAV